jgi:N-acetylglucosaminyltransferase
MNLTALLLVEKRPASILMAVIAVHAILTLSYSVSQWIYATRFRRGLTKQELARQRQARHDGAAEARAVDVIVPCYNENPTLLAACCGALEQQRRRYPGRIHIWLVDDGSQTLDRLEPVYREFEKLPNWTVIRHLGNLGKRRAQDSAFKHGTGAYVVTVDSDTVLRSDCVARLAAAMDRNPHAGAFSSYVRARNAESNRLTALIDRRYDFLFRQERAAQGWHHAVGCTSGPVAIYRRPVLDRIWRRYVEDTFFGRQRHFGDDLKLTLLVLEQGYDSYYEPSAKAWTNVPETLAAYARQQVRWNKSFYRELPRAYRALCRHLRSRRSELPGAHRYVRFELAARVLVPLLAPAQLSASTGLAMSGDGDGRWLPLLASIGVLLTHAVVIGLQSRSWRFPLLYGPIHLAVLPMVRLRALFTLANSHWGTRQLRRRPWPAGTPQSGAAP